VRALTFHGIQDIRFEGVDDPRIESPGDVIVRVSLTAVCGSDLHVYHGRETGLDRGTVMGHEFVGEVVETGEAVRGFSSGDRVMSPFTTNCGECFFCRHDLPSRCERGELFGWVQDGKGLHGTQAEYVRVPLADATLVEIPDGVGLKDALLLGDVFSTGYFCADMAGVGQASVCVVLGCGPVGLMAVVAAGELGAGNVYAVDSIDYRLEVAQRFGATPIDLERGDPVGKLREATGGRGADVVLEAAGTAAAGRLSYDLVRPGGTIAVAGVHTDEHLAFSPAEAYDKNITYCVGRCPARYYMDRLLPIVQEGRYDIASVFTHHLPLVEGAEAYRIFDEKRDGCVKVALEP
jgi:threonine dehydrogenase-like Zn-dependent dehydrogenase